MPTLNGSPLSCEEILDRYAPLVYRMAIQGTGSRHDGEDVAQEVFVSLIQCDPAFVDETHLKAWLIRATANRCKSWGRSPWRRRVVPLDDSRDGPVPPPESGGVLEAVAALPPNTAGRCTSTTSRGTLPLRSGSCWAAPEYGALPSEPGQSQAERCAEGGMGMNSKDYRSTLGGVTPSPAWRARTLAAMEAAKPKKHSVRRPLAAAATAAALVIVVAAWGMAVRPDRNGPQWPRRGPHPGAGGDPYAHPRHFPGVERELRHRHRPQPAHGEEPHRRTAGRADRAAGV